MHRREGRRGWIRFAVSATRFIIVSTESWQFYRKISWSSSTVILKTVQLDLWCWDTSSTSIRSPLHRTRLRRNDFNFVKFWKTRVIIPSRSDRDFFKNGFFCESQISYFQKKSKNFTFQLTRPNLKNQISRGWGIIFNKKLNKKFVFAETHESAISFSNSKNSMR